MPQCEYNKNILYQIKGMDNGNMNIGDANTIDLDEIGELTLLYHSETVTKISLDARQGMPYKYICIIIL